MSEGAGGGGQPFPVHSFGFGFDHDAGAMHTIAEETGGMFSFVEAEDTVQVALLLLPNQKWRESDSESLIQMEIRMR